MSTHQVNTHGRKRTMPVGRVLGLLAILAALIIPATAHAGSPIREVYMETSTTQAGGHPDLVTVLWTYNRTSQPEYPEPNCNCQDPRSVSINSPAGLIADPHATAQCTQADFAQFECPIESEVGWNIIDFSNSEPKDGTYFAKVPVYNLIPPPNTAGMMGFNAPSIQSPVYMDVDSRTESDYGLEISTLNITHLLGLSDIELHLWGVPADPSHDVERFGPVPCNPLNSIGAPMCTMGWHSNAPLRPFISNPTSCGEDLFVSAFVLSYDNGTDFAENSYPTTTGCDLLSFNPSLFGRPTSTATDSASGLEVDLKVPQQTSPTVPSPSSIRGTTVTLPEGFSINPNAADGKLACSDAQANIGVRKLPAECPEFAKIGTLQVESSSLPAPMPGFIYLAEPMPGNKYRILLAANGFGLHVMLPGSITTDPVTGQVTTSFRDLPQFPFSDFNMHFFGSERGLLATPDQCGTYPVESTFEPWDGALPDQTSEQFFKLESGPADAPCPGPVRPFSPTFHAGVTDKTAGAFSPFRLDLSRPDGDQNLVTLSVKTPPGFSASLSGIPYCPEASIAQLNDPGYSGTSELISPACPVASQVGRVVAGAGAGDHPVYVSGKAYLAGPYKGAPLSLVFSIPAISGPYDLGDIAVRAALRVDPRTAEVTTDSDPFPLIKDGIRLRTRSVQVYLDRPNFTVNPTNCAPLSISASAAGDQGGTATLGQQFQIAECSALDFGPTLSMQLSGGVNRLGHPAIHAVLRSRPGEANPRRISVTLPKGELLDNSHIGTVCTRVAFAAKECPVGSRLGRATVTTPLLGQPLQGVAYLRSSSHALPDLALDLHGQVDFEAVARIDSVNGRLRTTFEEIPDIPLTRVALDLAGGRKGILQNSESLCEGKKRAAVRMQGQSGAATKTYVKLQTPCGSRGARPHRNHLRQARAVGK